MSDPRAAVLRMKRTLPSSSETPAVALRAMAVSSA
jgi:hypothetical protein